jgi:hypothetical protein
VITCTCPQVHTASGPQRCAMDIACPIHGDPAFRKPAPEELAKAQAEIVQTTANAAVAALEYAANERKQDE